MYVQTCHYLCLSIKHSILSPFLNTRSGADVWPSLQDLSAAKDAGFSDQSGAGDVHDQDNLFVSGWKPSYLLCSAGKTSLSMWLHQIQFVVPAVDPLLHCCVFLRQDKIYPPPALAL